MATHGEVAPCGSPLIASQRGQRSAVKMFYAAGGGLAILSQQFFANLAESLRMGSRWLVAVAAAVMALSSCGTEGPDAQRGPLLTARGTVALSQRPISKRLVPALMFTPYVTNWGFTEYIVSGETEGSFPSDFTLRVYDHLPQEALTVLVRGEPEIAIGGITAVAREHPRWLEWSSDGSGHSVVCSDQGECVIPSRACPDPQAETCLGTIAAGKDWGDHGIAGGFMVLYLAEPALAGGVYSQFFAMGEEIPAGYSVIRHKSVFDSLSKSQQSTYFECLRRATSNALSRFNSDHGTNYADHNSIADGGRERDIKLLADWDGMMIASTVSEGCVLPGAQQLVQDSAEQLRLVLVDWSINGGL